MEQGLIIELIVAATTILAAAVVGGRAQGGIGAFLLGVSATIASAITVGATYVGLELAGSAGGWLGLLGGILLAGALAWPAGNKFIGGKSGKFACELWLGFCLLCVSGFLAGGWIGLLTITVPAVAVFWIGLFRTAAYVLPLRDEEFRPEWRLRRRASTSRPQYSLLPPWEFPDCLRNYWKAVAASQWRKAFRSIMTHAMGTNYPYYHLKEGRVEKRIDGKSSAQFFAGPGLVLAECDQAGFLTDGIRIKDVLEPGLNFTGWLDLEPKVMDLRPQLCSFPVEALTRNGLRILVPTHVAFQIHAGSQEQRDDGDLPQCRVTLGRSFSFRHRAIYTLAAAEPVQHSTGDKSQQNRHQWDTELIPMITTRILQDIVSGYDMDELCPPVGSRQEPYLDVVDQMNRELRRALAPLDIEFLDGWLGNLEPCDEAVTKRRLDNWRTEWEGRILGLLSRSRATRTTEMEQTRAQAELEILIKLREIAESSEVSDLASQIALSLRFIDCLGEVVTEADSQWPLPKGTQETLRHLRGEVEEGIR